jgi:hypothetical protein
MKNLIPLLTFVNLKGTLNNALDEAGVSCVKTDG